MAANHATALATRATAATVFADCVCKRKEPPRMKIQTKKKNMMGEITIPSSSPAAALDSGGGLYMGCVAWRPKYAPAGAMASTTADSLSLSAAAQKPRCPASSMPSALPSAEDASASRRRTSARQSQARPRTPKRMLTQHRFQALALFEEQHPHDAAAALRPAIERRHLQRQKSPVVQSEPALLILGGLTLSTIWRPL